MQVHRFKASSSTAFSTGLLLPLTTSSRLKQLTYLQVGLRRSFAGAFRKKFGIQAIGVVETKKTDFNTSLGA